MGKGKGKKFIDKRNATTFQLVHRSHRDAEYHNDEASSRVLVEVPSSNQRSTKQTREQLAQDFEASTRANVGEAAEYGIYYDDTEYDYMQHLRPTGGAGAVLLENPVTERERQRDKQKQGGFQLDLPLEAQPSVNQERPRNYQDQQSVQDDIAGFRPDMDPRIREVLMALEEEDDPDTEPAPEADSEDWFAALAGSGEVDEEDFYDEDFDENLDETDDGYNSDATAKAGPVLPRKGESQSEWEQEFAKFKKAGSKYIDDEQRTDVSRAFTAASEGRIKWGTGSIGTGFSMSSSALWRNEGKTMLDDRFDRVEREYDAIAEEEDEDDEEELVTPERVAAAAESRQDFEAIMDDFLTEFKNMGNKGASVKARNPYTLNDARIAMGNEKLAK
ncbi:Protein ltv1 [Savitreella phatthalungensis]